MGSLCGQVNMTWRMNRSAVTLFLQPPLFNAHKAQLKAA